MNIKKIIKNVAKPELYEKGTAQMWTDEYISTQLLEVHLNKEIDLASRKQSNIETTVDWILNKAPKSELNILDLGCGPGLYAELLTQKGHRVTGVDFSKNSIDYAKSQAKEKNLGIKYINQNYLDLDLPENSFDLVMIIYADLGVLLPDERDSFLKIIKKVLKPGGIFIFDVLNDKDLEKKVSPKSWKISEKGFWRNKPYMALSESFLYPKQKVILNQHVITDESENVDVYRFWTHFYSHEDLSDILKPHNFTDVSFYVNVLPANDLWSGDHLTFCMAIN